jgi:DNA repair exonuclease SbcCD nuclease subunit
MIRTTKKIVETVRIKKVDLILCSDFHLREDKPVCRTDDFVNVTQWKKLDFISDLQKKYNCPVLHGGDLFHYWKPSPELITATIEHLPKQFYTIYGQHDLPQHNIEAQRKCGIFTLATGKHLTLLPGCHWGQTPDYSDNVEGSFSYIVKNPYCRILVWHKFNYVDKEPWPDCADPKASKLLKKYPNFPIILTGDNHQPFVQEYEGRILVNPGSLSRQRASETHLPRVYLYDASTNTVEPVYIPIEEGVITREHLEKEEQRNERIDTFVSQLSEKWKVSLSFEDNLQRFEKKNQVRQSVMSIVYQSLEV